MATMQGDAEQLMRQGQSFYQSEQFTQALVAWQKAVSAYQQRNEALNQALSLSYMCVAYQKMGRWTEAANAIAQSLDLLQSNPKRTPERDRILAQVLNTQGNLKFAQGQVEQALEHWERSAKLYAQLKDENKQIGSLINQAQAQQSLGFFLRSRQTLTQVEKTLQTQSNSALKATGLRSLGNVLLLLGDTQNAERVLQQSLATSGNEEISATLMSLGNVARAKQDRPAALKFYQQAAERSSTLIKTQAQLNQLRLLAEQGQKAEARLPTATAKLTLISTIPAQLDQLAPSRSEIYARINFAQSLMRLGGEEVTAAKVLAIGIQHAKELEDQRAEAYTVGYLGSIYERNQQWGEAQKLTEQALLITQAMNAADMAYQWQWQLGRILKAQGKRKEAIGAYTAAFDTLQSIRSDLVGTNPDLQFSFRESVEPVYRELVDLLLRQTPGEANLQKARQVIESLQLAELDNFFRTACLEGQTVAIDKIDQTATAVIYPIILSDRIEMIVSLPGQSLRQYTAIAPQQTVERTLDQLRRELEQPFASPEGRRLGQQVYDWLIRPMATDLKQNQITNLAFVLDGRLRNVPMAALHDGKQFLIENYSVALTPGLQLLNPRSVQQVNLKALVAGLSQARSGFSALPNVQWELEEIKTQIPSRVLLNEAFTGSMLQKQINASPFTIVHLATHGQFSSNAENTFILAWDRQIKVNELQALLRTREGASDAEIELLVLSACETAEGDPRAALGIAGVAIQAGARSTVASLWSVDDQSGARLISQFYRELANAKVSKAEALRRAQLSLLRDKNYRQPIHWAPFVLVGNWL
ncbi:CHAT domain-containing protein [Phormidesmis sp. 146-33]